jgi:hypothetical protein
MRELRLLPHLLQVWSVVVTTLEEVRGPLLFVARPFFALDLSLLFSLLEVDFDVLYAS